MNVKKSLFFPLLAAFAMLAGCGARGESAPTPPDMAAPMTLPSASAEVGTATGIAALDLEAPEALPPGAHYEKGVFTLTAAGTYRVSGSLSGRLCIDAAGPVELILDGVFLTGQECIAVLSDEPVTVTSAAGTENMLSDGAEQPDENARAVVYSEAPLELGGEGVILVSAGANNGIQTKDSLTVSGGELSVTAANHGLKAKGALTVFGGVVGIRAGNDGLNAESARIEPGSVRVTGGAISIAAGGRGIDAEGAAVLSGGNTVIQSLGDGIRGDTVTVSGGALSLTAEEGDGVQAVSDLTVSGGELTVTTGGGGGGDINKSGDSFGPMMWASQTAEPEYSAKGLKSDGNLHISGGVMDLSTADDSIHCSVLCTIDGGDIAINSADDAIHADDMLVINDGSIRITDCFEGLEAFAIEVNGGDIVIRAVNDGINANGPEMMGFGASVETGEAASLSGETTTYYRQTGGVIDLVVTGNSRNVGDGVDSNGSVFIDGGVLVVSTFGNTQESGIDIGRGELRITGGMVMAGGAAMMQESISESSTQCSAVLTMDLQSAGTAVTITDEDGNEIWSVTMVNAFNCLVLSHPDMRQGHVYTVTYGGSSSTLDFTNTTVINNRGGFGFGFPGGRPF